MFLNNHLIFYTYILYKEIAIIFPTIMNSFDLNYYVKKGWKSA